MSKQTKIATCCYCGARATLAMDKLRQELVCSACGAPIQNIEPIDQKKKNKDKRARDLDLDLPFDIDLGDIRDAVGLSSEPKRKDKKKRKGLKAKLLDEAFDFIEDIFD